MNKKAVRRSAVLTKLSWLAISGQVCCLLLCPGSNALTVDPGKIEHVVLVSAGESDSTVVTEFIDNWLARGPNSFDVDSHGNIYILDWLGEKVLKFNRNGEWVSSIPIPRDPILGGITGADDSVPYRIDRLAPGDIAVDNRGFIYVTMANRDIVKLSPEGKLQFRLSGHEPWLAVDNSGHFFGFSRATGSILPATVCMYSSGGKQKAKLDHDNEYQDRLISQKEASDDLYFRVGRYLARTSFEDYIVTGMLDTVAILPNKLRLTKYEDDNVIHEECPLPPPFTLLGFDKNARFYFRKTQLLHANRASRDCERYLISVCQLENQEFRFVGSVQISFLRDQDPECSYKGLWDFAWKKRFIVSGDGTIYLMHGTVDTVKVSKITFEPKSE